MSIKFFLIMGVSGSGKTTIGKTLAERLGWDFYDADEFHPAENIAKMSRGIPLTDEDRLPWLKTFHDLIGTCIRKDQSGVLACSALKAQYREQLLIGNPGVQIVYIKGDYDLIRSRMFDREEHYMKAGMLNSQYAALDEPVNALVMDASLPVDKIVSIIIERNNLNDKDG